MKKLGIFLANYRRYGAEGGTRTPASAGLITRHFWQNIQISQPLRLSTEFTECTNATLFRQNFDSFTLPAGTRRVQQVYNKTFLKLTVELASHSLVRARVS